MYYIDYAELEANFEQYVERAYNEEEIVITRDGKPLVKLVEFQSTLPSTGALKGQYTFETEASSKMDKEIEDLFYAGEMFPEGRSVVTTVMPATADHDCKQHNRPEGFRDLCLPPSGVSGFHHPHRRRHPEGLHHRHPKDCEFVTSKLRRPQDEFNQ